MAESLPTLGYAPPSDLKGRWVRRAAIIAVLLVVSGYGWHRWPQFRHWVSLAALRHRVLTSAPAASSPAVAVASSDTPDTWLNTLMAQPANDGIWEDARADLIPMLPREPGAPILLFLHERDTPAGVRRALALHLSPMSTADTAYISLYVRLFDPGTVLNPTFRELAVGPVTGLKINGTIPGFPGVRLGLAQIQWGHAFAIGSAQPDPTDPSRFFVPYTLDGQSKRIIGRLDDEGGLTFIADDGSSLPLAVHMPATKPSSTRN